MSGKVEDTSMPRHYSALAVAFIPSSSASRPDTRPPRSRRQTTTATLTWLCGPAQQGAYTSDQNATGSRRTDRSSRWRSPGRGSAVRLFLRTLRHPRTRRHARHDSRTRSRRHHRARPPAGLPAVRAALPAPSRSPRCAARCGQRAGTPAAPTSTMWWLRGINVKNENKPAASS